MAPDLDHAERFLDELFEIHAPKAILVGVDYWWFNSRYVAPSFARSFQINETELTSDKLTLPWKWLKEGKLEPAQFVDTLLHGPGTNSYTDFANLGVFAIRMSGGWRIDGSYLNTNAAFKTQASLDSMQEEVDQIVAGTNDRAALGCGEFVDPGKLRQFESIARKIASHGTRLVVILPPVAPAYLEAIEHIGHREYIRALSRKLAALPIESHDFTDTRSLRSGNCEFLDGWHPGEVMNLRLLDRLLSSNPKSALASLLNPGVIRRTSEHAPDRCLVLFEGESGSFKRREACFRPRAF